ncbi:hypothetical protein GCM10022253_15170 [Sphingomonas endophytica]
MAGVVALAGALDLDDVRAEIGEQLPGPWAGEDTREFEDAQAGEGADGHALRSSGDGDALKPSLIAA